MGACLSTTTTQRVSSLPQQDDIEIERVNHAVPESSPESSDGLTNNEQNRKSTQITNQAAEGDNDNRRISIMIEDDYIHNKHDSIDSIIRKLSVPDTKKLKNRFQPKQKCSNTITNTKTNTITNGNDITNTNCDDFHIRFGNRYKSETDEDDEDDGEETEIKEKEDEASSETNSKSPKPTQIGPKHAKDYKLSGSDRSSTEIKEDDEDSSSQSLSYFESITKLTAITNIGIRCLHSTDNETVIEKDVVTPIHGLTSLRLAQSSPSDMSSRLSLKFNQKSLVSIPSNKKRYKYAHDRNVTNPFYHDINHINHDDDNNTLHENDDHTVTIIKGNDVDMDSDHTLNDNMITADDEESMQSTDDESYGSYNWYQSFNRASKQKAVGHDITKMVQKIDINRNRKIIFKHSNNPSIDSMDSDTSKIVNFDSTEILNMNKKTPIVKIPKIRHQLSKEKIAIHKLAQFRRNRWKTMDFGGFNMTPKDTPRDSFTRSLSLIPSKTPTKTPTNHPSSNSSFNLSIKAQMSSMSSIDSECERDDIDDEDKLINFKAPTPTNFNESMSVLVNNSTKSLRGECHAPFNTPIFGSSVDTIMDESTDNEVTPSTVELSGIHNAPPLPLKWIQNGSNNQYYQYTHYNYYYYDDNDKQKVQQVALHRPSPPPHAFNAFSNHKSDFEDNDNLPH